MTIPTCKCLKCEKLFYEKPDKVVVLCDYCNTGDYLTDVLSSLEIDHATICNQRGYADA